MIAYLISAYKDAPQLRRLIDALDVEADFYIHVDANVSDEPFRQALQGRRNVRFVARHHVSWGGWVQVLYQVEMLRAALSSGVAYSHVFCLSGQDFPLWSRERLAGHLRQHPHHQFIGGMNLTRSGNSAQLRRIRDYHFFRDMRLRWWCNQWLKYKFIVPSRWLFRLLPIKKPLQVSIDGRACDIYYGSDYWALTADCARYVLDTYDRNPHLARYFQYSFVPSELCINTIVHNSPFASDIERTELRPDHRRAMPLEEVTPLHLIDYKEAIHVFTLSDWEWLQRADKPFFRKAESGASDTLIQRILNQ